MSKRQEIRDKRRREKIRNRLITIFLVIAGALLITFALIIPSLDNIKNSTSATQTAQFTTPSPVIVITPNPILAAVDGVHIGNPNAPVKVDVYGDFRCSACRYFSENIEPQIIQTYVDTGKVYLSFYSFIVIDGYDNTDASYRASLAAMCAADQNKFWPYHDTLYANQVSEDASLFTDDRLIAMAQNVGLEMTTFTSCLQTKQHAADIENDIAQGHTLGVTGTPSPFVNGTYVEFTNLVSAIDTALASK
jgi:protein-disulfide isomerase